MICKLKLIKSYLVFLFIFSSSLFAQDQIVASEKSEIDKSLELITYNLKELSKQDTDFKSFIQGLYVIIKPIESNANLKERFLLSPVGEQFQDLILSGVRKSYIKSDVNFSYSMDLLLLNLKAIYPNASPFIFKLKKLQSGFDIVSKCIEGENYPTCLWEIAFRSDNIMEDGQRLAPFISQEIASPNIDDLSYLLLSIVESDFYKIDSAISECGSNFKSADKIRKLKDSIAIIELEKDFSQLKTALSKDSLCYKVMKKVLPKFSLDVCEKGHISLCLKGLDLSENIGVEVEIINNIKKEFILSAKTPEQISLSDGLMSKQIFSQLTLGERFYLLFKGRAPSYVYLIVLFFFFFPIFIGVILYSFPTLFHKIFNFSKTNKINNQKMSSRFKLADKEDEYSALLSFFGLDDDATNSDLKRVYREMAKRLHPDSGVVDEKAQVEFEKLQIAYERLMELRKGWFGMGKE